ncbi:MAG TPA: tetratricopeptide repeat protein [Anaerolineales bacterium]|nr:tetratricopeptide repeat protein [Anaerolineales bacterium]
MSNTIIRWIMMRELPSGTVTFLFTDIEGSTRLLQQLEEKFAILDADHERILRQACEAHRGTVLDIHGDAFFVVFPGALDAVRAVAHAQRELAAHQWIDGVSVRVRMGLHTGEPQMSSSGYMGMDVHRAARIAAAGHGGQVLISQTTYDLVKSEMPEGVTLRDLGEHRLKDLRQPKHLYQLVITGLPADFPPLKSLNVPSNNLPTQLTSFIGRETELAEIKQILNSHRLVTLTGPGGSGKTRLALQIGNDVLQQFQEGVVFVPLAPVTDPRLVPSTIAQTLDVAEVAGQSVVDVLKSHLQNKSLLLVLDNFEQVTSAAPVVSDLLAACSKLKILVTSREILRVYGEKVYPVPPLGLPDLKKLPPLDSLSQYTSIRLFLQRAQAVKPDFQITDENASSVAEICHRLDGLPLAIELAAARIRLLPPRTMLSRLERRLEFLTGGARDLPARQQTLRHAITWSYDLLAEDEQKAFRRLSVFVGGCTIGAIEAIFGEEVGGVFVLDQIGSLLDKSLIREVEGPTGEARFMMLELLREFGLEQLQASGEEQAIRRRHTNFYLALAEEAEARLESGEQAHWIHSMEQEHDNLRAALEWTRTAEDMSEHCLRLAGALGLFWETRGYFSEGRERLSAILAMETAQLRTSARARLLARAAELAYRQSDYAATVEYAEESLGIYREINDWQGTASMLIKLGNAATEAGDYAAATEYLNEALTIWRERGDRRGTARALISLGWAALKPGDHQLARARLEEALTLSRELKDTRSMGFELSGLGEIALRQGEYARAKQLLEESLGLRQQLGNKWGIGVSAGTLGWVAIREGNWKQAMDWLAESLEVRQEIGDKGGCAWCLERLAEIAMAQQNPEKALRLLSAAAKLRIAIGSVIDPVDQEEYQNRRSTLRKELGEERFAAVWHAGHAMTLEQAIEFALS